MKRNIRLTKGVKVLLVIFVIMVFMQGVKKEAPGDAPEGVVRTVSNENPEFGEEITVTLTATIRDENGVADDRVTIEEALPSWAYDKGNFNEDFTSNLLKKFQMSLGGYSYGTTDYSYSYIITAPARGTLAFSGIYIMGEGSSHTNIQGIEGTQSITVKDNHNRWWRYKYHRLWRR